MNYKIKAGGRLWNMDSPREQLEIVEEPFVVGPDAVVEVIEEGPEWGRLFIFFDDIRGRYAVHDSDIIALSESQA